MAAMLSAHTLRQVTRWVALWFVLSLSAAVASPLIQPRALTLICSGMGVMKVMVQTDDGAVELGHHSLDCPLCANLAAPPPQVLVLVQPKQRLIGPQQPIASPQQPCQPHEPWQARAPPRFS